MQVELDQVATFRTKAEIAYSAVRDRIVTGRLAPGSIINQEELAAELGISTTPLREALRILESDGFVRLEPHRDAIVVPLSSSEAAQVYELRSVLDPLGVQLAAERHTQADAAHLRELGDLLDTSQDSDALHVKDRNRAFHRAIYAASGNPTLVSILDRLWAMSERYRLYGVARLAMTDVPVDVHHSEHRELLDLVLTRAGREAAKLMERHVAASRDSHLHIVESLRER